MVRERAAMECFDAWVEGFIRHVTVKGHVPGQKEAIEGAKSTTNT
jgi:hypothetical protein